MRKVVVFGGLIFLLVCMVIFLSHSCNRKGNGMTIPQPPPTPDPIDPIPLNVYIENSGSMNGYVNGVTEFKTILFRYLSLIENAGFAESFDLYYINSRKILIDTPIENFINNLTPTHFAKMGGNLGTTEISDVIKSVLSNTSKDTISILVTDGIFSPGKKDPNQYLEIEKIKIMNSVDSFMKANKNPAIIVYKLSALFNGTYFNRINTSITINEQRPFYLWVIGNVEQLTELHTKILENDFQGSAVQQVFSTTTGNKSANYAVKMGSGNFKLDRKSPKTTITKWKTNTRGLARGTASFSINADLSGFLLSDDYLLDTQNYELSDKDFSLSITKSLPNTFGYSHEMKLTSSIVKKTSLSIKLKNQIPPWVEETNDYDGSSAVAGKTYGIIFQIQGVYEAFTNNTKYFTEIKIEIK